MKEIASIDIKRYINTILTNEFNFDSVKRKRLTYLKDLERDLTKKEEEELSILLLLEDRNGRMLNPKECEDFMYREHMNIGSYKIIIRTGQVSDTPYIELYNFDGTKKKIFLDQIKSYSKDILPKTVHDWLISNVTLIIDYWFSLIYSEKFYKNVQ